MILEIGLYRGGSLDMWQHYFGGNVQIYGVDIKDGAKFYADSPNVRLSQEARLT